MYRLLLNICTFNFLIETDSRIQESVFVNILARK